VPQDASSGGFCGWGSEKQTCQRLWEAIADSSRPGQCFTAFCAASQAVIPEEQHRGVGKETGETAAVERWKNSLRQRLARFVRMTLSFSKSVLMYEAYLLPFLHRYNGDRAILLKRAITTKHKPLQQPNKALTALQGSLTLLSGTSRVRYQSIILTDIARAYEQRGAQDEVCKYINQALTLTQLTRSRNVLQRIQEFGTQLPERHPMAKILEAQIASLDWYVP
jgi:IS1 family transposase